MRGPLFDFLFTRAEARAIVAVATIGTTFALLLASSHHRGRALLELVNADGEEANHVLVDVRLTLQLRDCRGRRVEIERDVMRLAVLGDAVCEAAQAPRLGLRDLPAIIFDDLGGVFRERIDLGLCKVLTREENMLVERHVSCSLSWPIADVAQCGAPPAVVQKLQAQRQSRAPVARL
jgi:hypothetical protein